MQMHSGISVRLHHLAKWSASYNWTEAGENMNDIEQRAKILSADGFIAALDQSGGSTPKALKLYGN
jgi:hypothetical protein